MDRILIILKKENGPRASSAPALGLNTIIFKHVYWYMQQTQVSVYRTIGPLVIISYYKKCNQKKMLLFFIDLIFCLIFYSLFVHIKCLLIYLALNFKYIYFSISGVTSGAILFPYVPQKGRQGYMSYVWT